MLLAYTLMSITTYLVIGMYSVLFLLGNPNVRPLIIRLSLSSNWFIKNFFIIFFPYMYYVGICSWWRQFKTKRGK